MMLRWERYTREREARRGVKENTAELDLDIKAIEMEIKRRRGK